VRLGCSRSCKLAKTEEAGLTNRAFSFVSTPSLFLLSTTNTNTTKVPSASFMFHADLQYGYRGFLMFICRLGIFRMSLVLVQPFSCIFFARIGMRLPMTAEPGTSGHKLKNVTTVYAIMLDAPADFLGT
jgi:hypothetical protein